MPKTQIQFRPVRLTGKPALRKKRIRQSSGKMISVYSLDADGANLAVNLNAVFEKNVAAARRANASLPYNLTKLGGSSPTPKRFAAALSKLVKKADKKKPRTK